jgi:hypothetical protein
MSGKAILVLMATTLELAWAGAAHANWSEIPGGGLAKSSAVALTDSSTATIFVVGTDNGIWKNTFHPGPNTFDGWRSAGGSTPSGISAGDGASSKFLAVRGWDNHPWFSSGDGSWWQTPALPGGLMATGTPAVAAPDQHAPLFITLGSNGDVFFIPWVGTWLGASWSNTGHPPGKTFTDVTAAFTGGVTLIASASDATIWENVLNLASNTAQGWTQVFIKPIVSFPGAPLSPCLNSMADRRVWDTGRVSYRTANFSGGSAGCRNDLSGQNGYAVLYDSGPNGLMALQSGARPDLFYFFDFFGTHGGSRFYYTNVSPSGKIWIHLGAEPQCGLF